MFYSRKANSKINHIHERSLRIVYKNNIPSFEELLKKDKFFCIHKRNIQLLSIELFKVKINPCNRKMCDIFETRNLDYNLRSKIGFRRTRVNTSSFGLSFLKYLATKIWDFGLSFLKYLATKIWDIAPYDIKSVGNLNWFKKKMNLKDVIADYANNIFPV